MGVGAAAVAIEAGQATSSLLRDIRTPTSFGAAQHSPLWGHCGPGLLTAGGISGLQDSPCGQGGGEGRRSPKGVRYKEVYGCEKRGKKDRRSGRG